MTEAVTEFGAEVVDIRQESRLRWQLLLDRTEFSASASIGTLEAVAPSGVRIQVPVLGVVPEGEAVWHVVEKPLAAGTPVTGRVAQGGGATV